MAMTMRRKNESIGP